MLWKHGILYFFYNKLRIGIPTKQNDCQIQFNSSAVEKQCCVLLFFYNKLGKGMPTKQNDVLHDVINKCLYGYVEKC